MGIINKIKNIFTGGNTLYYPGCLTKFALPNIFENYCEILKNLGIEFITLSDNEFCCGSPVLNAGFADDFYDLKKKNHDFFKNYGISKIITNCPSCFYMFKKHYPKLEVEHITQTIHKKLKKIPQKFKDQITYHDPCHLGRKSNIYIQPREIINKLGFEIIELTENKVNSLCCGGGGGLINNFPELSNKIANLRLSQSKTKKLVTPCPMCYKHFKNNAKNMEILEFSELLI
ncbi:MAG: (Fe-S)-binding protein [Nanoarchaeota archaeon]|nr:(Fe-S)-binding protein [Nanoarchaeota archaeon]